MAVTVPTAVGRIPCGNVLDAIILPSPTLPLIIVPGVFVSANAGVATAKRATAASPAVVVIIFLFFIM